MFLKSHNVAQMLCNFCCICNRPSRIGQTLEQPNQSQNNLVSEHHGHSVVDQLLCIVEPETSLYIRWIKLDVPLPVLGDADVWKPIGVRVSADYLDCNTDSGGEDQQKVTNNQGGGQVFG